MMNQLGYPVSFESASADSKREGEGEGIENTQSESASEPSTETPAIPTEQKTSSKGLPPIVFVILGIAGIIGAVIIAYVKREKNESDLYID